MRLFEKLGMFLLIAWVFSLAVVAVIVFASLSIEIIRWSVIVSFILLISSAIFMVALSKEWK